MKALSSIWQWLARSSERRAVEITRRRLLELDDRTLADIGVSRALLERGPQAWPWRPETEPAAVATVVPKPRSEARPALDRAA